MANGDLDFSSPVMVGRYAARTVYCSDLVFMPAAKFKRRKVLYVKTSELSHRLDHDDPPIECPDLIAFFPTKYATRTGQTLYEKTHACVLHISCQDCQVPAGQMCRGPMGQTLHTHATRRHAFYFLTKRRNNPDEDLRALEREYHSEPSEELRRKLNVSYLRSGLPTIPIAPERFYMFSEGWQAQTTEPDGRVISSATQSHDGWWGVGHATWSDDDNDGKIRDLGDHGFNSIHDPEFVKARAWHVENIPKPTPEEVIVAHRQVVDFVRIEGVEAVSEYHRWDDLDD